VRAIEEFGDIEALFHRLEQDALALGAARGGGGHDRRSTEWRRAAQPTGALGEKLRCGSVRGRNEFSFGSRHGDALLQDVAIAAMASRAHMSRTQGLNPYGAD
jgi:hypothetical protein